MANGWLRRKRGSTLFCFYNAEGRERSRTIGAASMSDKEAWTQVGDLGLDKLVDQVDPECVTFGELAAKYLAGRRFKKASTKEIHEQIIKGVVLPRFATIEAIKIGAKELKSFFLGLDVGDTTRGKYRAVMSRVFSWGISEELIPSSSKLHPAVRCPPMLAAA
jgi:hypothetical protein